MPDDLPGRVDGDDGRQLAALVEGDETVGVVAVVVEVGVAVHAVDEPGDPDRVLGPEPAYLVLLLGRERHIVLVLGGTVVAVDVELVVDARRRELLDEAKLLPPRPSCTHTALSTDRRMSAIPPDLLTFAGLASGVSRVASIGRP